MDRWSGRVALVTGAAGGMGSAIIEKLIKSGMKVVGCDINTEELQAAAKKLENEKGEFYIMKCNLRKEEEILSMFSEIKKKFGGVDVCLNVAGILKPSSLIHGETEVWRNILEVNVLGLSICTRESIKSMRERGVDDGHIIHLNSTAGHICFDLPEVSMYVASKHAVSALTEELRQELRLEKSNIRISSVSPGTTRTRLYEGLGDEEFMEKIFGPQIPMLSSEQIADTIMYILAAPPEVQVHDVIIRHTESPL